MKRRTRPAGRPASVQPCLPFVGERNPLFVEEVPHQLHAVFDDFHLRVVGPEPVVPHQPLFLEHQRSEAGFEQRRARVDIRFAVRRILLGREVVSVLGHVTPHEQFE